MYQISKWVDQFGWYMIGEIAEDDSECAIYIFNEYCDTCADSNYYYVLVDLETGEIIAEH